MSVNDIVMLDGQGAGITGPGKVVTASPSRVLISADSWGDGSVALQYLRKTPGGESWIPFSEGSFTANAEKILDGLDGMTIRAVTAGSTGPVGATVIMGGGRGLL